MLRKLPLSRLRFHHESKFLLFQPKNKLIGLLEIAEDENMKPNCLFCKSENMQVNDVEGSEPVIFFFLFCKFFSKDQEIHRFSLHREDFRKTSKDKVSFQS